MITVSLSQDEFDSLLRLLEEQAWIEYPDLMTLRERMRAQKMRLYDPEHDAYELCARESCNHPYFRHFDWMMDYYPNCKYCMCPQFKERYDDV